MSNKDVERWSAVAQALNKSEVKPVGMPIGAFLLEADGVARFVDSYWEPAKDGSRPGLKVVAVKLPKVIGAEIVSLVGAARTVHTGVLFPPEGAGDRGERVERAQFLVTELGAACEFVLDDDVTEPADEAFAEARARASADSTLGTLVQSLVDHAGVADTIRDRLAELEDFDAACIAEARSLAETLRAWGPATRGVEPSPAVDLRNRLFTLIARRVGQVRGAAQYVYRHHPEVARRATSAYQRGKRLEARHRKAAAEAKATEAKAGGQAPTGGDTPAGDNTPTR